MALEVERRGGAGQCLLEEAPESALHVLRGHGPAALRLVSHPLDEPARGRRPQVGGDQRLFQLVQQRRVHGPPDGEDAVEAVLARAAGFAEPISDRSAKRRRGSRAGPRAARVAG